MRGTLLAIPQLVQVYHASGVLISSLFRGRPLLNSQDAFADFTAAIFHDRWLPVGMRSAQRLDQASRKSIFRQRRLESVFVLQLFTLLRGEIGFEKNFARVILLPYDGGSPEEQENSEQCRTGSLYATSKRHDKPAVGRIPVHRRRELPERARKVETFICKKRFEF